MLHFGPPEPDLTAWEGRMMMRTQARREIEAMTSPPAEPADDDEPPVYTGWGTRDGGATWQQVSGDSRDFGLYLY